MVDLISNQKVSTFPKIKTRNTFNKPRSQYPQTNSQSNDIHPTCFPQIPNRWKRTSNVIFQSGTEFSSNRIWPNLIIRGFYWIRNFIRCTSCINEKCLRGAEGPNSDSFWAIKFSAAVVTGVLVRIVASLK